MSKKQPKLTPWFMSGETPKRAGVYEVYWCYSPVYARFTKRGWMHGAGASKTLAAQINVFAAEPPSKWRGLAVKP